MNPKVIILKELDDVKAHLENNGKTLKARVYEEHIEIGVLDLTTGIELGGKKINWIDSINEEELLVLIKDIRALKSIFF